jgi:hypothetical protein
MMVPGNDQIKTPYKRPYRRKEENREKDIDFSGFTSSNDVSSDEDETTADTLKRKEKHRPTPKLIKRVLNKISQKTKFPLHLSKYERTFIHDMLERNLVESSVKCDKISKSLDPNIYKRKRKSAEYIRNMACGYMWTLILGSFDKYIETEAISIDTFFTDASTTINVLVALYDIIESACRRVGILGDFWQTVLNDLRIDIMINSQIYIKNEIIKREPFYLLITDSFLPGNIETDSSNDESFRNKRRYCILFVNVIAIKGVLEKYLRATKYSTHGLNSGLYSLQLSTDYLANENLNDNNSTMTFERYALSKLLVMFALHSLVHAESYINDYSCCYDHVGIKSTFHNFSSIFTDSDIKKTKRYF